MLLTRKSVKQTKIYTKIYICIAATDCLFLPSKNAGDEIYLNLP